jgi:hypothetical protein
MSPLGQADPVMTTKQTHELQLLFQIADTHSGIQKGCVQSVGVRAFEIACQIIRVCICHVHSASLCISILRSVNSRSLSFILMLMIMGHDSWL